MVQGGSGEGGPRAADKPRRRKSNPMEDQGAAPPAAEEAGEPSPPEPEPRSPFIRGRLYGSGA
ncbi:MAG: hypothetical protein ICV87_00105 [Gemmatimonadetes bacterium]|nr:hypothetical protein [Gemmatimonadota bacterium]